MTDTGRPSDDDVRDLRERARIAEVMYEFTARMDGQEPERVAELMAEDVVVEHAGGGANGRDAFIRTLVAAVGRHFTSHHMISNERIRIRGDRARMVCYFHSVHLDDPQHPERHADHGGWYLVSLARSAGAWRIARLKQVSVWSAADRKPTGPLDAGILPELRGHLDGIDEDG